MQISQQSYQSQNQHYGKKIAEGLNGEIYFYNNFEEKQQLDNNSNNSNSLNLNQNSNQFASQKKNQKYVIKIFKNALEFRNEEQALRNCDHPNIIKIAQSENYKLIMKYYKNGDLFDFLQGPGQSVLGEKMAKFFFKQMAQAVSHIHQQGFVHRDIKLENILIDDDYKLVLSDFGLSTRVSKGELLTQYIGTSSYMAPEIVAKQDYYGESCDIFALGVILFCLLYQNYPFQGKAQPSDPHYKYFANKNHIRYWLLVEKQTKKFYSPELKSLINGMLAYDVNERITMEEILEHEWLNTDVPSQEEVKQIIQEYYQEQEQKMEEDDLISNSSSTHLDNKLQGNYGQEGVKQKC